MVFCMNYSYFESLIDCNSVNYILHGTTELHIFTFFTSRQVTLLIAKFRYVSAEMLFLTWMRVIFLNRSGQPYKYNDIAYIVMIFTHRSIQALAELANSQFMERM